MKIVELLLAQGSNPLDTDSFLCVSPFTDWFRIVGEKLDFPDLSSAQVDTVVAVTNALLSSLQPEHAHAFKETVFGGETGPDTFEAEKMLEWPGVLLEKWKSQELAKRYDTTIPLAPTKKKPSRF